MITIKHYPDGGVLVKGINPSRCAVHEMLYAAGDWTARYPPPAIPIHITFHRSGLVSIKQDKQSRHWYNI